MARRSGIAQRWIAGLAVLIVAASTSPSSLAEPGVHFQLLDAVPEIPSAVAVKASVNYPMSSPCAEPPRFCHAKTQWIHAYVHCRSRTVALIELRSMDLNGDVFATLRPDAVVFAPPGRDSASHAIVDRLCGEWRSGRRPRYPADE